MKQDHKVMMEKDICPKTCKCIDLKCQALHSAERHDDASIYYDQMDIMEQASTNFLMSIFI